MPTYNDVDGKPFTVPSNPADARIVTLCSKFFGRLSGQSLGEFGNELKALTDKDKQELVKGFCDGSLNY